MKGPVVTVSTPGHVGSSSVGEAAWEAQARQLPSRPPTGVGLWVEDGGTLVEKEQGGLG